MPALGDLNGDGINAVVGIVITPLRGNATFSYLKAVLNQNDTPNPLATAFLGDRVIIQSIVTASRQIAPEMINQGPDEPMCCPNQGTRGVTTLQDQGLNVVEQVDAQGTEPAVAMATSQNASSQRPAPCQPLSKLAFPQIAD